MKSKLLLIGTVCFSIVAKSQITLINEQNLEEASCFLLFATNYLKTGNHDKELLFLQDSLCEDYFAVREFVLKEDTLVIIDKTDEEARTKLVFESDSVLVAYLEPIMRKGKVKSKNSKKMKTANPGPVIRLSINGEISEIKD